MQQQKQHYKISTGSPIVHRVVVVVGHNGVVNGNDRSEFYNMQCTFLFHPPPPLSWTFCVSPSLLCS